MAYADRRLTLQVLFGILILSAAAQARQQAPVPSSLDTRAAREGFLSKADLVSDAPVDGRPSWRATLDDGSRKHDAWVETADGTDPTRRNYKFNVAAYEDKLLRLNLVPPSVERTVTAARPPFDGILRR